MTGDLLRDVALGLLALFTAVLTPFAALLARKAADYFEQKTKIQIKAEYRQALEYAVPTAIAATEEWAQKQLNKPSATEKFNHAARVVRSIAPKAADAAGEALSQIIEGKVPVVRATTRYQHSPSSLPPPDRIDPSRLRAPKVPT